MINNPLNPQLFVRILKLSDRARSDLLEFVGATSPSEGEVERILEQVEAQGQDWSGTAAP